MSNNINRSLSDINRAGSLAPSPSSSPGASVPLPDAAQRADEGRLGESEQRYAPGRRTSVDTLDRPASPSSGSRGHAGQRSPALAPTHAAVKAPSPVSVSRTVAIPAIVPAPAPQETSLSASVAAPGFSRADLDAALARDSARSGRVYGRSGGDAASNLAADAATVSAAFFSAHRPSTPSAEVPPGPATPEVLEQLSGQFASPRVVAALQALRAMPRPLTDAEEQMLSAMTSTLVRMRQRQPFTPTPAPNAPMQQPEREFPE